MAILSRDDFFNRLHARVGNDTSEESISFLEDMTDTFNDLERRSQNDGINWEQKYKDLDESWKARYRHRFFSGGDTAIPNSGAPNTPIEEYNGETITVDDLFEEKKGD